MAHEYSSAGASSNICTGDNHIVGPGFLCYNMTPAYYKRRAAAHAAEKLKEEDTGTPQTNETLIEDEPGVVKDVIPVRDIIDSVGDVHVVKSDVAVPDILLKSNGASVSGGPVYTIVLLGDQRTGGSDCAQGVGKTALIECLCASGKLHYVADPYELIKL